MAVRRILTIEEDEEFLRQKSAKVTAVDRKITNLVRDLTDTLFEVDGAGISAIQIGAPLRVIVVRALKDAEDDSTKTLVLINPEIIEQSSEMDEDFDACLSVPGYWGLTDRALFIRVRYQNRFGRSINGRFEGFLARIVQHEIDHLSGILYTDHIQDEEKFFEIEDEEENSGNFNMESVVVLT